MPKEGAPTKRVRIADFADSLNVVDKPVRTKKRKGNRKNGASATKVRRVDDEGEVFNIDDVGPDDEDEEDHGVDGPQAHQKRFYKGNQKLLIEASTTKFRIYLLNVNAFPNNEDLMEWTEKCFVDAGMDLFGARYHGEYWSPAHSSSQPANAFCAAVMPPFTNGIRKLVSP